MDADEFKWRQRQLWSIGDYSALARHYAHVADDLVKRLDVQSGMQVLDIATGTGNAALAAARSGAEVVGLDLTPEMFDEARLRADVLDVAIEWKEGDAEALPYPDGAFDRVVSAFGLMYAPRGDVAAAELVRVLRPGGRFALCNWSLRGAVQTVFDALGGASVPSRSAAQPMPWGEPDAVRDMFHGLDVELAFDTAAVWWVFPSAEDGVRWLEEVSGPVIGAKAGLQASGLWAQRRAQLVEAVEHMVRDDIAGIWASAEYLIATGSRTR